MVNDVLNNMMARVERCRLLARETTDPRTARALHNIADEGKADVERLYAQLKAFDEAAKHLKVVGR